MRVGDDREGQRDVRDDLEVVYVRMLRLEVHHLFDLTGPAADREELHLVQPALHSHVSAPDPKAGEQQLSLRDDAGSFGEEAGGGGELEDLETAAAKRQHEEVEAIARAGEHPCGKDGHQRRVRVFQAHLVLCVRGCRAAAAGNDVDLSFLCAERCALHAYSDHDSLRAVLMQ